MSDTPFLNHIKNVMEKNIIPMPGGVEVIEEIWLLGMVFDLNKRYRENRML